MVENLFRDLIEAGVDPARIAKKDSPAGVAWQVIGKDDYAAFIATNARMCNRRHRMGFRQ